MPLNINWFISLESNPLTVGELSRITSLFVNSSEPALEDDPEIKSNPNLC